MGVLSELVKPGAAGRRMPLSVLTGHVEQLIAKVNTAVDVTYAADISAAAPERRSAARNLAAYLALRSCNLQNLQVELQHLAHVEASLAAVRNALLALDGRPPSAAEVDAAAAGFSEAAEALNAHSVAALGQPLPRHRTRIMVTAPPDAATDPSVVRELLAGGMTLLRINCAHDGAANWARMVAHLRAAERELGLPAGRCKVQFDLAGPKLRTGPMAPGPRRLKWHEGDVIAFTAPGAAPPAAEPGAAAAARVPLQGADGAALLAAARVGDVIGVRCEEAKKEKKLLVRAAGAGWALAVAESSGSAVPDARVALRRADGGDGEEAGHAHKVALAAVAPELPREAGAPLLLRAGDVIDMRLGDGACEAPASPGGDFVIYVDVPEVFDALRVMHTVAFDDGKLVGSVVEKAASGDRVRVRLARVGGGATAKLAGEKGINLPDSHLVLPAMTAQDRSDLVQALELAPDAVAMSFVQTPADVRDLHGMLAEHPNGRNCGVVLKVETAVGFTNLSSLLFATMARPEEQVEAKGAHAAVMIARGDLGVEVGFARLAEVQEEALWLCEAAHTPAIWATQVLESLAKGGVPTRGEVTDAASAGRAEAVMLNKGPFMADVLSLLHDVLGRMQTHESKKMHLMRQLNVARHGPDLANASSGAAGGAR